MDTWFKYIFTIVTSAAGGAFITYFLNKKGNIANRELKNKEIELKQRELELKEEEQRLNDLPDLQFGNTMMTSPMTGELNIEIHNVGSECTIFNIDSANIKGKLLNPKLPCIVKKGSTIMLEFILPKGDPILTQTFPKYSIGITLRDIHKRKYSCDFIVNNIGSAARISVTPLKLIK